MIPLGNKRENSEPRVLKEMSVKRLAVAVLLSEVVALLTFGLSGCGGASSQPVAIGLTSSANGIDQGQTVSITALVTNDPKNAGVQWSVSGGGTLSGQTTTSATYNAPALVASTFTATVTATSIIDPTKTSSLQFKVSPLPTITTTSLAEATAGNAYIAALSEAGGTGPYKWTLSSGTLPTGLILSSAGAISGTPTGPAGNSSVTFELTDAAGASTSQAITIRVNAPPALNITTASLLTGTIGTPYSQTLQATGGVPAYTWNVTAGSLPAGLTLSSAGVISGTPTGTSASTSNFSVTVTDSQTPTNATKSANLSITVVEPALSVTTTSLAGGSTGNAYSQTLQAIGGTPPYTWSISAGALSAALSLNASTGVISGTPTTMGTSTFTVKVTDSAAGTATAALSITIDADLAITTTSLPGGSVGTAYGSTVQATGGAQLYTWSITSGSLPAGLSINASSGAISGTPTATGTSDFTVTVEDSESPNLKANASLSIAISSQSCPNNSSLNGHYAMLLNGWSSATTVTAAVGSFVADGGGNISSGSIDLNDQSKGPVSGTFTGTYCVSSNNLATISLTYGGALIGSDTFAAALNSSGSNGTIIFYDNSNRKASGLLRQQSTSAFSTNEIKGNYAFGFVGANRNGGRYAVAGAFSANGGGTLSGFYDSDVYGVGPVSDETLSSNDFSVASAGRGTATITFTGSSNLTFVFYVVSASELLAMEDDSADNSLLAGQVLLQQTSSFTEESLNSTSVLEVESLAGGLTVSATAGLVVPNGSGTIALSTDQNLAGTMTTQSESGTYTTSTNGRVTLSLGGVSSPPVLYLIGQNQAFVVGTNNFTVDFGMVQPQSGSNFNASSLSGAYLGGSLQPVDASVNEEIDAVQANGEGSYSETSESNGSAGASTSTLTATYAVSPNGRVVVSQNGAQVGLIYVISDSQIVLLPASASDTDPRLSEFQH